MNIKFYISLLACGLLAACSSGGLGSTATPYPTYTSVSVYVSATGTAYCQGQICIHRISIGLKARVLAVRLDFTDQNGKVMTGVDMTPQGKLLIAIYKDKPENEKLYLFGAHLPKSQYSCYLGNDIPEYAGQLASICTMLIPHNLLQERVSPGDLLYIELPQFNNLLEGIVVKDGLP